MSMDLGALRRDYTQRGLTLDDLKPDPFDQFALWFQQAMDADLLEPNALVLSSVSSEGMPFQRTVLLKYFDQDGFVFFTNYGSRKAQHIEANPKGIDAVSLVWAGAAAGDRRHRRQNFHCRILSSTSPRGLGGSQLGAWVSQQSSIISSRQLLEMQFEKDEGEVSQPGSSPA